MAKKTQINYFLSGIIIHNHNQRWLWPDLGREVNKQIRCIRDLLHAYQTSALEN